MCGIVGVIGESPVAQEIYLGLLALKHRGSNSSGIVTYNNDDNRFYRKIGARAVDRTFSDYDFTKLKGTIGIGHNRYATSQSKEALYRDAQPIFTTRPGISIAYNGHLESHPIRDEQIDEGWNFHSSCDAEFIIQLLSQQLIENKAYNAKTVDDYVNNKLFPAVTEVMKKLSPLGSFSVVAVIDQWGILAFKDPHGFRPLSFARKIDSKKCFAFASETSAFHLMGNYREVEELDRGEAIFIDTKTYNVHRKTLFQKRSAFCSFEQVYFADVESSILDETVYITREKLGEAIASTFENYKDKIDRVVAIPRTPEVAAIKIARLWNKEYGGIIRRGGIELRTFLEPTQQKREYGAKLKYLFIKTLLKNQRIAIIDDSIVRGTTVKYIIKNLKQLGVKEIHLFSLYPPIQYPCKYGIDTPEKKDLIASKFSDSIEELGRFLGVDSLNYLPLDKMVSVLGRNTSELCTACITGEYLT